MKKKDASFWSDIKTLDERLKKDPDSFCFARLSEIYLMVGLVADALHTARSGVARHPGYLAGQRALGMACNASGLHDECRGILEHVTAAMPEDVDAQKVLAGLYTASGEYDAAIRIYETALEFRPDDRVCIAELETLQRNSGSFKNELAVQVEESAVIHAEVAEDEEEILELSESDVYEELVEETASPAFAFASSAPTADHHDPLSTLTLAQLYEKQGFVSKALDIYRSILTDDPTNSELQTKVSELSGEVPVADRELEDDFLDEADEELEFPESSDTEEITASQEPEFSLPEPKGEIETFETVSSDTAIEGEEPVSEITAVSFEPEESVAEFTADVFESGEPVAELTSDVFEPEFSAAEAFELPVTETPVAFEPIDDTFSGNLEAGEELEPVFDEYEPIAEPLSTGFEIASESFDSDFGAELPVSQAPDTAPRTLEAAAFAPLAHQAADNVVETLDGWLENIRRIKACR